MAPKKCRDRKIKEIPKLEDAHLAGTEDSQQCTLIVTEGDSAKLAVAGFNVIDRNKYGVFPLRGKMLNVRKATHEQIMRNDEVKALVRILGLQYKKGYANKESMCTLRYGKLMIMTDQDVDGSDIKGLIINFIHKTWPELIKHDFVEVFVTPIIKAMKEDRSFSFYSLQDYVEWCKGTTDSKSYEIRRYKGLGTHSAEEIEEYFTNISMHLFGVKYGNRQDDNDAIKLAFSDEKAEERKTLLKEWLSKEKDRQEDSLYRSGTRSITPSEFINKELVLFFHADCVRSIPSSIDGLKPSQRKIMFACFKRAYLEEVGVERLVGVVNDMAAYITESKISCPPSSTWLMTSPDRTTSTS